eukprot:1160735-Pelagomonas_calceolata.AAC.5
MGLTATFVIQQLHVGFLGHTGITPVGSSLPPTAYRRRTWIPFVVNGVPCHTFTGVTHGLSGHHRRTTLAPVTCVSYVLALPMGFLMQGLFSHHERITYASVT